MGRRWPLALGLVVVVVAVWFVITRPGGSVVDGGRYPRWVLAQQEDPSHLVQEPPLWEYLLPWHWGAEEVCIGCLILESSGDGG